MNTGALLSVKQVAELVGLRRNSILTLIHTGQLRACNLALHPGGRPLWKISPDELESFIERRTHSGVFRRVRCRPVNVKHYF